MRYLSRNEQARRQRDAALKYFLLNEKQATYEKPQREVNMEDTDSTRNIPKFHERVRPATHGTGVQRAIPPVLAMSDERVSGCKRYPTTQGVCFHHEEE